MKNILLSGAITLSVLPAIAMAQIEVSPNIPTHSPVIESVVGDERNNEIIPDGTMIIYGKNFSSTNTITFSGGVTVTEVSYGGTSITVLVPKLKAGPATVTVTNSDGLTSTPYTLTVKSRTSPVTPSSPLQIKTTPASQSPADTTTTVTPRNSATSSEHASEKSAVQGGNRGASVRVQAWLKGFFARLSAWFK